MVYCREGMRIATLRSNIIIYPFELIAENRKPVSRFFLRKLIIIFEIDFLIQINHSIPSFIFQITFRSIKISEFGELHSTYTY